MPTFAPVDEQLTYIKKGSSEIIRESDLREKLEKSLAAGKPLRVKAGFEGLRLVALVHGRLKDGTPGSGPGGGNGKLRQILPKTGAYRFWRGILGLVH